MRINPVNQTSFHGILGQKHVKKYTTESCVFITEYKNVVQDYFPFSNETSEKIEKIKNYKNKKTDLTDAELHIIKEYDFRYRIMDKLTFSGTDWLSYCRKTIKSEDAKKITQILKELGLNKYII